MKPVKAFSAEVPVPPRNAPPRAVVTSLPSRGHDLPRSLSVLRSAPQSRRRTSSFLLFFLCHVFPLNTGNSTKCPILRQDEHYPDSPQHPSPEPYGWNSPLVPPVRETRPPLVLTRRCFLPFPPFVILECFRGKVKISGLGSGPPPQVDSPMARLVKAFKFRHRFSLFYPFLVFFCQVQKNVSPLRTLTRCVVGGRNTPQFGSSLSETFLYLYLISSPPLMMVFLRGEFPPPLLSLAFPSPPPL